MQGLSSIKHLCAAVVLFLILSGCHTTKKATSDKGKFFNNMHWTSGKVSEAIKDGLINYHTLSARVHIDYEDGNKQYNNVTAFLRMKKDSAIWLSVRPVLGIEMARLMLTPDSIKLRNNLKNRVYLRSADDIRELLHLPFDFSVLESLLLGNPVFIPRKIKHFHTDTSGLSVTILQDSLVCKYQWSPRPFLLKKSFFQISGNPATAGQYFSDYQKFETGAFAMKRTINLQQSTTVKMRITFDKIRFDVPVQFPFRYN